MVDAAAALGPLLGSIFAIRGSENIFQLLVSSISA